MPLAGTTTVISTAQNEEAWFAATEHGKYGLAAKAAGHASSSVIRLGGFSSHHRIFFATTMMSDYNVQTTLLIPHHTSYYRFAERRARHAENKKGFIMRIGHKTHNELRIEVFLSWRMN